MKKFRIVLSITLMVFSLNLFAQDTIRFTWDAGTTQKDFSIHGTSGKVFSVAWGDGATGTVTGTGNFNVTFTHTYSTAGSYDVIVTSNASDGKITGLISPYRDLTSLDVSRATSLEWLSVSQNNLTDVDVRNNPVLGRLYCDANDLTSLDVSNNPVLWWLDCASNNIEVLELSNNTALTRLYCQYNELTRLDVNNSRSLSILNCNTNHIPLSDLFTASFILSSNGGTVVDRRLGPQTLLPQTAVTGVELFTDCSVFVGRETVYSVVKNGSPVPETDYEVVDGKLTFNTSGVYTVTMTNEAIISAPSYPATVTVEITVTEVITNTYTITATADVNGTISPSGEVVVEEGTDKRFTFTANSDYEVDQLLIDGVNVPDSIAGGSYTFINVNDNHTIAVSFRLINGVDELRITDYELQIYPNPTRGELRVTSYELQVTNVEVFDIYGKKVSSNHLITTSSHHLSNIAHLPSGIYFVKIRTEAGEVMRKAVKE
jgi:hypothetical protein